MNTDILEDYIATANLAALNQLLNEQPQLAKAPTSHGVSPLMLACYYKKQEVVALLLKHIDEINLFEASAAGKLDVVAYMLSNRPDSVNNFAPDGFTPLGMACYFGQAEVARYLVMKGADVNLPSNNGYRVFPLHSAAAHNYTDIARMLINAGALVNIQQQAGVTPMHSAAQNGNIDLLIALLEHGADVSIRMEGGKLPADLARDKGFKEIAEILE